MFRLCLGKKKKKWWIFCKNHYVVAQVPLIHSMQSFRSPWWKVLVALCRSFALDLRSGAIQFLRYFSSKRVIFFSFVMVNSSRWTHKVLFSDGPFGLWCDNRWQRPVLAMHWMENSLIDEAVSASEKTQGLKMGDVKISDLVFFCFLFE